MILQSHSRAYIWTKLIRKDTCTPMFTAALFTIAKTWKQPYVSINRWMDRQSEKILLSHKKEWNNTICSHMDRPRDYHSKWNQLETKINNIWFHLHVESKKQKYKQKPIHKEMCFWNGRKVGVAEQKKGNKKYKFPVIKYWINKLQRINAQHKEYCQ